jgi:hypothetical protein
MSKPNHMHPAVLLGGAGLLPQAACLALVTLVPDWRWTALAAACFYAAAILSFLGGIWWMQGLATSSRNWKPYLLGVAPSLLAWAALLPWCFGWTWPEPSLFVLGSALLVSPLADRALQGGMRLPGWWMSLRHFLAGGLGTLTIAIGLFA